MSMQQNDYYQTNDFCLASFLLSYDINPTQINTDSFNRATFSFLITTQVKTLIEQFSLLKAKVEPLAFFSAQKKLKQLIYLRR